MMTLPPADAIDWAGIGLWASGITTVLVSVGFTAWKAIRSAAKVADSLPAPVTKTETNVITTDSVAMHELAATLEASNVILSENNILRREEHADRAANREAVEANTRALALCLAAITEARAEIKALTFELIRAGK